MPRSRLVPPELSVPPAVVRPSMPLIRMRVKLGPRPRTVILPTLAGVARDRHTRNSLQRLGEIQVREVGDVLGHDAVDGAGLAALDIERAAERLAVAANDDLLRWLLRAGERSGQRGRRCEYSTQYPDASGHRRSPLLPNATGIIFLDVYRCHLDTTPPSGTGQALCSAYRACLGTGAREGAQPRLQALVSCANPAARLQREALPKCHRRRPHSVAAR